MTFVEGLMIFLSPFILALLAIGAIMWLVENAWDLLSGGGTEKHIQ